MQITQILQIIRSFVYCLFLTLYIYPYIHRFRMAK